MFELDLKILSSNEMYAETRKILSSNEMYVETTKNRTHCDSLET